MTDIEDEVDKKWPVAFNGSFVPTLREIEKNVETHRHIPCPCLSWRAARDGDHRAGSRGTACLPCPPAAPGPPAAPAAARAAAS